MQKAGIFIVDHQKFKIVGFSTRRNRKFWNDDPINKTRDGSFIPVQPKLFPSYNTYFKMPKVFKRTTKATKRHYQIRKYLSCPEPERTVPPPQQQQPQ